MKETKRTENTKETLTRVFASVGEKHHYKDVEADFAAFRDMKVKWTRSYNWIEFNVSDYLKDAPEEVLESIADTIFERIKGNQNAHYNDRVCEWVSSDEFVVSKQPTYIERCRGLTLGTDGEVYDLRKSYDRLVEKGLLEKDELIHLGWIPGGPSRHSGFSSVLMKTICISKTLDDEDIPEDVLDYCIFAQAMHIKMGFDPASENRFDRYERLLDTNPDRAKLEKMMEDHNIVL